MQLWQIKCNFDKQNVTFTNKNQLWQIKGNFNKFPFAVLQLIHQRRWQGVVVLICVMVWSIKYLYNKHPASKERDAQLLQQHPDRAQHLRQPPPHLCHHGRRQEQFWWEKPRWYDRSLGALDEVKGLQASWLYPLCLRHWGRMTYVPSDKRLR